MKANVNPFEPWRPTEARVPPPLHANRPWRPPAPPPAATAVDEPPFVEAAPEPPRKEPRKHPPRRKRPQGRTGQPCPGSTRLVQWAALILLTLLGILCFDSVGWLSVAHMPRLIVMGASAGILAGMTFNYRRSWYSRLTWMATALSLAGIAAWLVPTLHGVNLWSGYRQIETLRTLPAGDVAEFQRGTPARRILVQDFPAFAQDISSTELAWLRRTVDEAIENADRQLEGDPHRAFATLQRLKAELAQLQHYPSVRDELEAARRRALDACVKVAAG